MALQMPGQLRDPACQQCDLDVCATRVLPMQLELFEIRRFDVLCHLEAVILDQECARASGYGITSRKSLFGWRRSMFAEVVAQALRLGLELQSLSLTSSPIRPPRIYVDPEEDERAYDREQDSGGMKGRARRWFREKARNQAADNRTRDTKYGSENESHVESHERFRNPSNDKTDNDRPDDV